ncbi:MAG: polyketide synthase dehydratase domain-containing protein, partial [Anaerolineales bacterium]|nr:polyketide synthase dehydratase domain-containing protein [Anaerolineales bacterium]
QEKQIHLVVELNSNGSAIFAITDAEDADAVYCAGVVKVNNEVSSQTMVEAELINYESRLEIGPFYGELRQGGLEYGAMFANVREVWLGGPGSGEAMARVALAERPAGAERYPWTNVVLMDSALHAFGAALRQLNQGSLAGSYVPASVARLDYYTELPAAVWSQVKIFAEEGSRAAAAQVRVLNDNGDLVAEIVGLELRLTTSLAAGPSAASNGRSRPASSDPLLSQSRGDMLAALGPLNRSERVLNLSRWLIAEIKDVMGQAAEGLELEKLPPSAAFLEIGLDSLLVTELQRRIQEKLNFRFQPMQGLDYQSIDSMSEFILDDVLAGELPAAIPNTSD